MQVSKISSVEYTRNNVNLKTSNHVQDKSLISFGVHLDVKGAKLTKLQKNLETLKYLYKTNPKRSKFWSDLMMHFSPKIRPDGTLPKGSKTSSLIRDFIMDLASIETNIRKSLDLKAVEKSKKQPILTRAALVSFVSEKK